MNFTVLTANTYSFISSCLIRGGLLFILWNWGMAEELKMQYFSYPFCFCLVASVKILIHTSIGDTIRNQINTLFNLMLLDTSTNIFKRIDVNATLDLLYKKNDASVDKDKEKP